MMGYRNNKWWCCMQVISVTSVNTGIKYWIMILLDRLISVNCTPPPPIVVLTTERMLR